MTIRTTDTFKGKIHSRNSFKLPCCDVFISRLLTSYPAKMYRGLGWRVPLYTSSGNPIHERILLDDMTLHSRAVDSGEFQNNSYYVQRLSILGFEKTIDSIDTYYKGLTFYDN